MNWKRGNSRQRCGVTYEVRLDGSARGGCSVKYVYLVNGKFYECPENGRDREPG